MTWVSWRLQRTETLIAAAILALIAVLLVPTGIEMANAYDHDGLSACLAQTELGRLRPGGRGVHRSAFKGSAASSAGSRSSRG